MTLAWFLLGAGACGAAMALRHTRAAFAARGAQGLVADRSAPYDQARELRFCDVPGCVVEPHEHREAS